MTTEELNAIKERVVARGGKMIDIEQIQAVLNEPHPRGIRGFLNSCLVEIALLRAENHSLQSRLQASEGERKENLQLAQMLTSDLQSCQSENEAFRTRIAELEKLCQEAAELLKVYHNENHIVKSACNTCTLVTRLQSAQPGSEKEAR